MSPPIRLITGIFVGLAGVFALPVDGVAFEGPPPLPAAVAETARESAIERALATEIPPIPKDSSLIDAARFIGQQAKMNVVIDEKALTDVGLDPAVLVTAEARKRILSDALDPIMVELDLDYVVQNDVLRITTKERAATCRATRLYPIDDLVAKQKGTNKDDLSIRNALHHAICLSLPEGDTGVSWARGPSGWMIALNHSRRSHLKMAALLADLRATRNGKTSVRDAKLEAVLQSPTTFDLRPMLLADAIAWLAEKHDVPMSIDRRALNELAIDPALRLSISVRKPISLESALHLLLDEFELTPTIQFGEVRITSRERAESLGRGHFYPIEDLLDSRPGVIKKWQYLFDVVYACIDPSEWDSNSGPPAVAPVRTPWGVVLFAPCGREAHWRIVRLLDDLRAVKRVEGPVASRSPTPSAARKNATPHQAPRAAAPAPRAPQSPALLKAPSAEADIEVVLARSTSFTLQEQPLDKAMAEIGEKHDIQIHIDRRRLAETTLDPDLVWAFHSHFPLPLGEVLSMMLADTDLAWIIRDETLQVTSAETAVVNLTTRVYPVADLTHPEPVDPKTGRSKLTDPLFRLILATIDPPGWSHPPHKGYGSLVMAYPPGGPAIVADCTHSTHAKIRALLADIRSGQASQKSAAALKIEALLQQPVTLHVDNEPLGQVITHLKEKYKLTIWPWSGRGFEERVHSTIEEPISLGAAFDLLLQEVDMTYAIRHDVMWLNSKSRAAENAEPWLFRMDDLFERSAEVDSRCAGLTVLVEGLIAKASVEGEQDRESPCGVGFFHGPNGWIAVVTTTDQGRHKVAALFEELRAEKK